MGTKVRVVTPSLPEDLGPVLLHVESQYPREGCGILFVNSAGEWRTLPMANAYDAYHAKDPLRFPRTSRTAYAFDSRDWLKVCEEADQSGEQIGCIFHSHVDVGAYFSAEDRAMAAPDNEPLLPGVAYLVVAVDEGKASAIRLFWWDRGAFQEKPIPLSNAR
jgi:proteasome lid subunit RPN8/RPN11